MVFDNNYHYNAMPVRLLVNIQDADSDGIQTASENNNGTRMGYNRPMEKKHPIRPRTIPLAAASAGNCHFYADVGCDHFKYRTA